MVMNFRNGKLVGNPLARLSRPVGDGDDLYVVLLCETRNMQGSGVATGPDQADADLFFGHEAAHFSVSGSYYSTAGRRALASIDFPLIQGGRLLIPHRRLDFRKCAGILNACTTT